MNRSLRLAAVGLVAGALGYAAGFLSLLTLTGLDAPGLVPVAQVTGAGLGAGLAVGLMARIDTSSGLWLAASTTAAGLVLGLAVQQWGDLEWALAAAAVLVGAAVAIARSMAPS